MHIADKITSAARDIFPEVVEIRKQIHSSPELSFQEHRTAEYICFYLEKLHIPYIKGIAGTGVLARIEGTEPGTRAIALRADMDALPIQEKTGLPFSSTSPGVMHACGHDIHTAMLLGTAAILKSLSSEFKGTFLLIFQPGEEVFPGGASLMLKEGIFEQQKPDLIIGQHVLPGLPAGAFGFRPGRYMASGDEVYLTIRGKGGHAATPDKVTNTVLAAAEILVELQQVAKTHAPKGIPTILSFGKITAPGATNIIPDEVKVEGTFRTMNEAWREKAHGLIRMISEKTAAAHGATCEVLINKGYPVLYNDPVFTEKAMNYARLIAGDDQIVPLDIRMGTEDFAWYTQEVPGVFYRLGTGKEHGLHTSTFDVEEDILQSGTAMLSWLAISFMKEHSIR
jgi:amidohydrolase